MDINQFEWDIVVHKPGFWKSTFRYRMPLLLPIAVVISYGIVKLSQGQRYIKTDELMIVLFIVEAVSLIIINYIWFFITQAFAPKLVHYKVSAEGIELGKKKLILSALKNEATETLINKESKPYQDWKQPRPEDGQPLELTFHTNQGTIKLLFPEEYVKQKYLRTLNEYLHPQVISPEG